VIIIPVVRETTAAAGSVTFVVDGVQLGTAVAITSAGDTTTELVTNGDFTVDANWTKGTGWTIAAGVASFAATGSSSQLTQPIAFVAGRIYALTFTLTRVAGNFQARFEGGTTAGASTLTASGTYTQYLTAATGNVTLALQGGSTFTGTVDNVSLKSVLLSADNASNLYLLGTSTTTTEGSYYDGAIYNRALSVTECSNYCLRGPDALDIGGSQTAKFTSDFSAGTNSFTGVSGVTVTGNQDAVYGVDDTMLIESNGSSSARARRSSFGGNLFPFTSITIQAVRPAANVTATGVRIAITEDGSDSTYSVFDFQLAADTWQTLVIPAFSIPAPVAAGRRIALYPITSVGGTTVTSGDKIWVKALTTYQAGITGHWPAFNAQTNTGQIFDQSGNKSHAMLPASGATVIGKPMSEARQVRWTNTWAGTQELQYIGGVNQAVLPATAFIESIAVRVSGADIHDIVIGDGVDPDRYVVISGGGSGHGGIALAAGSQTLPLATRSTDGTNLKLTVDPDTNCTMTMVFTITYRILE
jgi:hypothetical protein